jgi:3-oxoacyl-[acyl-carrier-protein] synthase III
MTSLTPSAAAAPATAILGIGTYRPTRVVPNAELVEAINSSDEWIQ